MQGNKIAEDVKLAKQLLEGTGFEVRRIRETIGKDSGKDAEKDIELAKELLEGTGFEIQRIRETADTGDEYIEKLSEEELEEMRKTPCYPKPMIKRNTN